MRHTGIRRTSTLETLTTRGWLSHGRHALGVVTWLLLFVGQPPFVQSQTEAMENKESLSSIALGAGCFWCVEAVFEQLEGVQSAVSGYMGGHIKNPGYREVCTGRTGHAEVVLVTFDEAQITLGDILEVFFATQRPDDVKPPRGRCWNPVPFGNLLCLRRAEGDSRSRASKGTA